MNEQKITIELTEAQLDTLRYALRRTQRDFEPYPSPVIDEMLAVITKAIARGILA